MRSPTKCLGFLIILAIYLTVGIAAGQAETAPDNSRANAQLLPPLTIDHIYMSNEIPGENATDTITLKGAIAESMVHNKEVRKANLEISRSKWDYYAAQTERLPNIKFIGYLGQQTVSSELIPARSSAFLFLSAFFPVTHQYRLGLTARVVKLKRTIAAERLRQQFNETRSNVKAAYYKLALDQSLLADIQDSIKYLHELKTTVAAQVKRGDSLKVENMEVAAKLAKAEYEQTKAYNTMSVDRERFNQLLGRELKAGVTLEAIPPPENFELDAAQAESQALSWRPEIREAEARVKQLNLEKRIIISEYIPNISIGVVYVAMPGFNNAVLPRNALAPGLFINWNAFDWGHKAMLAKARSKEEQACVLTAQTARENVIIDLHTQMNKLSEARQLVQSSQLSRTASREEMRVSLNRYKYTSARLADVLDAQSKLSDANNSYYQSLLSFWDAKAQFERAIGLDQ